MINNYSGRLELQLHQERERAKKLETENAKLRAVAEVAKHFYGICFDMPIDFPSAGPFVWGMGDLKDALAAAGYGGEE